MKRSIIMRIPGQIFWSLVGSGLILLLLMEAVK